VHYTSTKDGMQAAFRAVSNQDGATVDGISFRVELSRNLLKQFDNGVTPLEPSYPSNYSDGGAVNNSFALRPTYMGSVPQRHPAPHCNSSSSFSDAPSSFSSNNPLPSYSTQYPRFLSMPTISQGPRRHIATHSQPSSMREITSNHDQSSSAAYPYSFTSTNDMNTLSKPQQPSFFRSSNNHFDSINNDSNSISSINSDSNHLDCNADYLVNLSMNNKQQLPNVPALTKKNANKQSSLPLASCLPISNHLSLSTSSVSESSSVDSYSSDDELLAQAMDALNTSL
jgi:hypothetical protein